MIELTADILHAMLPMATDRAISKFLAPLNITFNEFAINTKERIAAFIAQIGYESGSLRYVEEIASGVNYEFREDLGNLEFEALQIAHANYSTTGKFYKGHGLIQITGYYNHKACAEALKIDCIHHPKLLCEPLNAARSAGWFWSEHGCNSYADLGNINHITRIINGGYNGKDEREKMYHHCLKVL